MASPCEVLLDGPSRERAERLVEVAATEVRRIERKFSRYRDGSIVQAINRSGGAPVRVDDETARLLDFADHGFRLSDGLFDVTSGVLRRAWTFDGSDRLPSREQVDRLRSLIGWEKVRWSPPEIALAPGMEIDFGGIGKEFAVDRALGLVMEAMGGASSGAASAGAALVNLGGDLRVSGPRVSGAPWLVGVEDPAAPGAALWRVELFEGALATSGDARRYLERDGVRYSHILDPRTGWPVAGAPRSVTILADSCTQAGFLATLAMLKGAGAEEFLDGEGVTYRCVR
jgi:thiamine biosynthesis lipoprotein